MPKAAKTFNYKASIVHYIYCLVIISLLTFASINFNKFIENQKVLGTSIDASSLQSEKNYWEDMVKNHPTYTDAYLELAKVYVEIGDKDSAKNLINEASSLNPNSEKISEVSQQLGF